MNCARLTVIAGAALLVVGGCKKPGASGSSGAAASASANAAAASAAPKAASAEPPCKAGTEHRSRDGKLTSCVLASPWTTPDGYTCEANKGVDVFADGALRGCYLATAKVVDGWSCKEALKLTPDRKLKRCKITQDRTGPGGVEAKAGDWVTVYPSGAVKRLEIASGTRTIQGLTCKGYLNFFHENGKLEKCELAKDATVEGKKIASRGEKGASVYVCFDDEGKRVSDCNVLTGMTLD